MQQKEGAKYSIHILKLEQNKHKAHILTLVFFPNGFEAGDT